MIVAAIVLMVLFGISVWSFKTDRPWSVADNILASIFLLLVYIAFEILFVIDHIKDIAKLLTGE